MAPLDNACCDTKPGGCGENEGDCDNDSHCQRGLICVMNNCNFGSFNSGTDCCTRERSGNHIIFVGFSLIKMRKFRNGARFDYFSIRGHYIQSANSKTFQSHSVGQD